MLFPQNTEPDKPYQKTKSRMGPKSIGEGQIVQVQGGHIIRATGRKDRHSKVFTAKGPRDRRVRLSAHTAIQFYDVQDRLGYDRPSKAVDWLIQNAKASIDKLDELPPLDPFAASSTTVDGRSCSNHVHGSNECVAQGGDSMKSFFPTTSEVDINSSMNLQNYPHSQDLCLSLQSLQDTQNTTNQTHANQDQTLFQGSESLGFDIGSTGWPDPSDHHNHQDMARFTRLMGWAGNEGRTGIMVNNANLFSHQQPLLLSQQGSAMTYSQRGTLQSSFPPFVRTLEDHQHQHQSTISSIGHGSDAFMGFCFPSHVHGDLHGGASVSNRASSSSFSPDSSQH